MRAFIWIVVFLVGVAAIVLPSTYMYAAADLPRLESEFDLETHLRLSVEGERMSGRAGVIQKGSRSPKFEKPDFAKLPTDLVALYISAAGCPTFFQTQREDGPRWLMRLAYSLMNKGMPGDGECERYLALRLAVTLGVKTDMEQTVAAHKLHAFLQRDQLIAWDMATMLFDRGVVGVEDAAWELYKKPPAEMSLAELAEFSLVLPINGGYYFDLKTCRNGALIKQNRDGILRRLEAHALVTPERARAATEAPVACLLVK